MKTAGVIGGIGPESTIEYYRLIMLRYAAHISALLAPVPGRE
jgi:aspartate/glutamate racemase